MLARTVECSLARRELRPDLARIPSRNLLRDPVAPLVPKPDPAFTIANP
jgi:hypothetical protein